MKPTYQYEKLQVAYQLTTETYYMEELSCNSKIRHYNRTVKPEALSLECLQTNRTDLK